LSSSEEDEEEEEDSDFEKENRGRPAKRPRPIRRKQLSSEPEENELDESSEIKEDAEESSDEDHISEVASDHDQESEEDDDEIPLPSYRRRGRKISENFSDEARLRFFSKYCFKRAKLIASIYIFDATHSFALFVSHKRFLLKIIFQRRLRRAKHSTFRSSKKQPFFRKFQFKFATISTKHAKEENALQL